MRYSRRFWGEVRSLDHENGLIVFVPINTDDHGDTVVAKASAEQLATCAGVMEVMVVGDTLYWAEPDGWQPPSDAEVYEYILTRWGTVLTALGDE